MCATLCLFSFTSAGQSIDTAAIEVQIDSLYHQVFSLTNDKKFEEALTTGEEGKQLTLQYFGENSIRYAKLCIAHGRMLFYRDELENPDTEKELLKAVNILKQLHPTDDLSLAYTLHLLGRNYLFYGHRRKSVAPFRRHTTSG